MNIDANTMLEFDALLEKLCEQQLSDSDRERLENLLREGNPWRQRYLDYMELHATLSLVGSDPLSLSGLSSPAAGACSPATPGLPAGEPFVPQLNGPAAPIHFGSRPATINGLENPANNVTSMWGWLQAPWIAMIAIVCFLAGGAAAMLWIGHTVTPPTVAHNTATNSSVTPVAYLTSANGCAWGGDSVKTWTVGHSVESGSEIALHEGIAEFRLANGVSFGVEGPASLLLVSPTKLALQYGKLTAHVPWGTDDFKILTSGCRLIARDAEFGVCLKESKLDIHVFSGEVAASSVTADGTNQEDVGFDEESAGDASEQHFRQAVVTAGRVLRLATQDAMLKVMGWDEANPALFVSKLSMSGPLPITNDYVAQVLASRPIGYWRFERISDSKIDNEIDGSPPLKAFDKYELVGGSENRSAELRSEGDWFVRTVKRLPVGKTDYSVEAWIKPSHFHVGRVIGLDCKETHRAGMALELKGGVSDSFGKENLGALRYVHHGGKMSPRFGTSCFSSQPYSVRRWQHVVAVKSGSQMKFYLDGKLSNSLADSTVLPNDAFVVVGIHHGDRRTRKFIGQVDEVAVYARALSAEEIERHYKAVKWVPKQIPKAKQTNQSQGKAAPTQA